MCSGIYRWSLAQNSYEYNQTIKLKCLGVQYFHMHMFIKLVHSQFIIFRMLLTDCVNKVKHLCGFYHLRPVTIGKIHCCRWKMHWKSSEKFPYKFIAYSKWFWFVLLSIVPTLFFIYLFLVEFQVNKLWDICIMSPIPLSRNMQTKKSNGEADKEQFDKQMVNILCLLHFNFFSTGWIVYFPRKKEEKPSAISENKFW